MRMVRPDFFGLADNFEHAGNISGVFNSYFFLVCIQIHRLIADGFKIGELVAPVCVDDSAGENRAEPNEKKNGSKDQHAALSKIAPIGSVFDLRRSRSHKNDKDSACRDQANRGESK